MALQDADSQRMRTVQALLQGYGSLSVPRLLEPLAEDFTHRVLPESLGMPARGKEAFSQHAAGIFSIFSEFRMIPQAVYDDVARDTVVLYAHMRGVLKDGKGEWANECVMIVRLSGDGERVAEITEFVDSDKAMEMRRRHAPRDFDNDTEGRRGGSKGETVSEPEKGLAYRPLSIAGWTLLAHALFLILSMYMFN